MQQAAPVAVGPFADRDLCPIGLTPCQGMSQSLALTPATAYMPEEAVYTPALYQHHTPCLQLSTFSSLKTCTQKQPPACWRPPALSEPQPTQGPDPSLFPIRQLLVVVSGACLHGHQLIRGCQLILCLGSWVLPVQASLLTLALAPTFEVLLGLCCCPRPVPSSEGFEPRLWNQADC